jgi:hypothetical protein
MLTRLNSDRRLIEDENQYRDELAGYVRSRLCREYAWSTKPLCAIINRGNGRAEVFHKSEHYVFDTKLHAFLAGL